MQTATTRQARKIVRNFFNNTFSGNTWTDKVARDAGQRRVAFKICYGSMEAQRLEQIRRDLQAMFWMLGYNNEVKTTDSASKRTREQILYCRDESGCYVRIRARAS